MSLLCCKLLSDFHLSKTENLLKGLHEPTLPLWPALPFVHLTVTNYSASLLFLVLCFCPSAWNSYLTYLFGFFPHFLLVSVDVTLQSLSWLPIEDYSSFIATLFPFPVLLFSSQHLTSGGVLPLELSFVHCCISCTQNSASITVA